MPATTPIGHYGLVGDTRTAALCSADGSLDWLCLPRFDGAPVFGRLVGGDAAGCFRLGPPPGSAVTERRYRAGSAVLETTWRTSAGELTLTEGMVAEVAGHLLPPSLLVRRLEVRERRRSSGSCSTPATATATALRGCVAPPGRWCAPGEASLWASGHPTT